MKLRAWILVVLCIPNLAVHAQYDEARLTVDHNPKSVTVSPDFDRPILHEDLGGQAVDLRAVGVAGENVARIHSTEMRGDPNGLLDNFANGSTEVNMTTDPENADVGIYPLTIGGTYAPLGGGGTGGGGGTALEDWEGLTETEVVGGDGDLVIDAVIRGASLPHSVSPGKTYVVQVTFSEALEGQEVTFSVEGGSADNGTATIDGDDTLTESGTITVKGGDMTEPDHDGNLKIVGKVDGDPKGESPGFSVCAHGMGYEVKKGDLEQVTGINSEFHWTSDDAASNKGMLNEFRLWEHVAYTTTPAPPPMSAFNPPNPTVGTQHGGDVVFILDRHIYQGEQPGGDGKPLTHFDAQPEASPGPFVATQIFYAKCKRCASNDFIALSDISISRQVHAAGNGEPRRYTVKVSGGGQVEGGIQRTTDISARPIAVISFVEAAMDPNDDTKFLNSHSAENSYATDGKMIQEWEWSVSGADAQIVGGNNNETVNFNYTWHGRDEDITLTLTVTDEIDRESDPEEFILEAAQ